MRARVNWTPDEDRLLVELSKTHNATEAAEILNRSVESVRGHIQYLRAVKGVNASFQKHGERHHNARHSDHDVELARQLLDSGEPHRVIAEKLEVPMGTVHDWCRFASRLNDPVCTTNL